MSFDDHPWVKKHDKVIRVACIVFIAVMVCYLVYIDTVHGP